MDLKEQLKSLSAQDRKELLKQLQQEEKESKRNRRDAYEGLRAQFMLEVKNRLLPVVDDVKAFRDWDLACKINAAILLFLLVAGVR